MIPVKRAYDLLLKFCVYFLCIFYCYEILIGERLVRQMKKYKEAMEERFCLFCGFVFAFLSIYRRPNRLFKYRELYYAVGSCGDILRS